MQLHWWSFTAGVTLSMTSKRAVFTLSDIVSAQLESSAQITSLHQVIITLVDHALDAGATSLKIDADFGSGSCTVDDDARQSSDSSSTFSSERRQYLSSLVPVSKLSIKRKSSERRDAPPALPAHLHSRPASRPISSRDSGSVVSVRDLFHNFPVRARQAASDANQRDFTIWRALKYALAGLLLGRTRPVKLHLCDTISRSTFHIEYLNAKTLNESS